MCPSRIVSAETLFANTWSRLRFWVAVTSGGCSSMHCRWPAATLSPPASFTSGLSNSIRSSWIFPVPSGRTWRQPESPETTRAGGLSRDGILHCARVPTENTSPERLRGDPGLDGRRKEMVRQSLALREQGQNPSHLAWCWARRRHSPDVYCPTREAPANLTVPPFNECVEHFGTKQRI